MIIPSCLFAYVAMGLTLLCYIIEDFLIPGSALLLPVIIPLGMLLFFRRVITNPCIAALSQHCYHCLNRFIWLLYMLLKIIPYFCTGTVR